MSCTRSSTCVLDFFCLPGCSTERNFCPLYILFHSPGLPLNVGSCLVYECMLSMETDQICISYNEI